MHHRDMTRRQFLGRGGALLLPALPAAATAQAAPPIRQDWNSFAACEHYASFIDGIARMRAVTDSADPRSWRYWSRLYAQQAMLGLPGFLPWNRSLLARFERQLQAVAGNPRLALPYWDCFCDPELPQEFTQPGSWNALHAPRAGNDVCAALSLAAFAPQVTSLQRGLPDAFEVIVESLPHNAMHNLLGHAMAGMQSPEDPIFWLFQANLDRLWTGWMLAAGRTVPAAGDPYWSQGAAPGDDEAMQALAPGAIHRYAQAGLPTVLSTPATPLSLTGRGADGGYYYAVYLNLPAAIDAATAQRRHLLGTIGAFEIAAARQRRARRLAVTTRVDFAATALLKRLARAPYTGLAVSFCRLNGSGAAPSGGVIAIGELRLELSMGADA